MGEFSNTQIIPILIHDDIGMGDDIAGLIIKSISEKRVLKRERCGCYNTKSYRRQKVKLLIYQK